MREPEPPERPALVPPGADVLGRGPREQAPCGDRAAGLRPQEEAAGGALLATPNNRSKEKQTPTCGCIFPSDSVLCASLKCLLYFSVCWRPEYCRSFEPLGSRCKWVEAGIRTTHQKGEGSSRKGSRLGTERPLGSKVATVGLREATRSVSQPPRRPVAGQPLRQPQ